LRRATGFTTANIAARSRGSGRRRHAIFWRSGIGDSDFGIVNEFGVLGLCFRQHGTLVFGGIIAQALKPVLRLVAKYGRGP
jgi:hypothetical protein